MTKRTHGPSKTGDAKRSTVVVVGQAGDAAKSLREAIATAVAHHQQGRLDEARALFRRLANQAPKNARVWFGLGSVDAQMGNSHEAILSLERAMALDGPNPSYHHNMASAKASIGRLREAEAHYEEAIAMLPDYAEAYFNYSGIKRFRPGDEFHPRLEELLKKSGRAARDRCFLHFAAGKVYDDIGDYDAAFAHYCKGNAAKQAVFEGGRYATLIERSIELFDPPRLTALAGAGYVDDRFVFVVGMPRSGTTLVEQILSSHSGVLGCGELPDIHAITDRLAGFSTANPTYPDCIQDLPDGALLGFGKAYAKRISAMQDGKLRYMDKQPNNFRYIGLIQALLPQARFIHCRRHPLDTCLSCLFQNFRNGQEFSFDIADLAAYYGGYQRLMAHWGRLPASRILDVDYEDLVTNTEEVSRRMVRFIGLTWEDRCMQFHDTRRKVHTASRWQVRQSIYTRSLQRWRNYQAHLGPLTEALESEGVVV